MLIHGSLSESSTLQVVRRKPEETRHSSLLCCGASHFFRQVSWEASAHGTSSYLWKEKPMLQYLITALLRALTLECVDLFNRHYRCTNACLVRWMEDRESFYKGY